LTFNVGWLTVKLINYTSSLERQIKNNVRRCMSNRQTKLLWKLRWHAFGSVSFVFTKFFWRCRGFYVPVLYVRPRPRSISVANVLRKREHCQLDHGRISSCLATATLTVPGLRWSLHRCRRSNLVHTSLLMS